MIFLNERELLPRMLASIERQRRTPELLLLVDDGSSDGSHEIATNFAAAHPYARVVRGLEREPTSDRLARAHELIAFKRHSSNWIANRRASMCTRSSTPISSAARLSRPDHGNAGVQPEVGIAALT